MSRDKRLTRAYHNARIEQFDDDSKYVFICDCHRGDGSLSDEFTRNENTFLHALHYYEQAGFTYVEVGDGDELWEHPQYRTIKRAHTDSFDAMQRFFEAGRLLLLWGNHNNELRHAAYVQKNLEKHYDPNSQTTHPLFPGIRPCEALLFKHSGTGQELLALHGHQGDFVNDQAWFFAMLGVRYLWRYLHAFGFRNPTSPAANSRKRDRIEREYRMWVTEHATPLLCGHTHVFSFPRQGDLPYFNAGCCVYAASITAIELENAALALVCWQVTANEEGVLQVRRQLLRGPRPLQEFQLGAVGE